jgi:SAM-dependent methyltransferase
MWGAWADHWLARFYSRHGLRREPPQQPPWLSARPGEKRFLHVGCGHSRKQDTVPGFQPDAWHEIRLDANAGVQPDIVASMTDMSVVPAGSMDAVFSSHNIEHLYRDQADVALTEFHRVLTDTGFLVITCPDLQSVAALIADDHLDDAAYESASGAVSPLDIVYGMQSLLVGPDYFMAHRCGFTLRTLISAVRQAGFSDCYGIRRPDHLDLWLLAHKQAQSKDALQRLAQDFIPA